MLPLVGNKPCHGLRAVLTLLARGPQQRVRRATSPECPSGEVSAHDEAHVTHDRHAKPSGEPRAIRVHVVLVAVDDLHTTSLRPPAHAEDVCRGAPRPARVEPRHLRLGARDRVRVEPLREPASWGRHDTGLDAAAGSKQQPALQDTDRSAERRVVGEIENSRPEILQNHLIVPDAHPGGSGSRPKVVSVPRGS